MTQKSDISLAHKWLKYSDNATLRQGFVVIEVHEDLFGNIAGINFAELLIFFCYMLLYSRLMLFIPLCCRRLVNELVKCSLKQVPSTCSLWLRYKICSVKCQ